MHQIEVKKALVAQLFPASRGWSVTVDLDAMELGKGPHGTVAKRAVGLACRDWFVAHGVALQPHPRFGRTDIVAEHPRAGIYVLEVEGESRRQPEQALYSAIGQVLLSMSNLSPRLRYGIAVPDTPVWQRQVAKLPRAARKRLGLHVYLVSERRVVHLTPSAPGSNPACSGLASLRSARR